MDSRRSDEGVPAAGAWIAFAVLLGVAGVLAFSRPDRQSKPGRDTELAKPARQAADPHDAASAQPGVSPVANIEPDPQPLTGRQLYLQHCAACHGEQGAGDGIAARFLFPKPRDFRLGKYRVVSTTNRIPSREDLDAVLVRGMPGSSMPPWRHLSKVERGLCPTAHNGRLGE